ncbi:MAG: hypothetical protein AABW90_01575 [Nanoarchaeota archaeon]|mgnify:CR=1 FL=1
MIIKKGYFLDNDVIIVNRELTQLDLFLKDFIDILKKYSYYLVVNGYVNISTGRTRATEDIDILFPLMEKEKFILLFNDLTNGSFWCYQGDNYEEVYSYIENFNNIRFAKTNEMFSNIEFIPINKTKKAKFFEFSHPQKIKIKNFGFKIPPIGFEILYKELVLARKKDIEDAKHLKLFFSDILKEEKFKEFKNIIK